jgi:hypothetical protein
VSVPVELTFDGAEFAQPSFPVAVAVTVPIAFTAHVELVPEPLAQPDQEIVTASPSASVQDALTDSEQV